MQNNRAAGVGPAMRQGSSGALQHVGGNTNATANDAEDSAHPDCRSLWLRQSSYAMRSASGPAPNCGSSAQCTTSSDDWSTIGAFLLPMLETRQPLKSGPKGKTPEK